jgi:hypothetical protein
MMHFRRHRMIEPRHFVRTSMSSGTQNRFEQIPYGRLTLVRKEKGDYNSVEYICQGQLGTYRLRIGQSITDDGKVFYIYQNNRLFLNLYPTRTKKVFVGKDEDGEYYIFRFEGKEMSVFKRKYEL